MAMQTSDSQKRATMIDDKVRMYLLPPLFNAAVRAGASIMQVYKNLDDYDISLKDDRTPITVADRLAHRTIREYLGPTRIPILSEEGREMRYEERCNWELYWLVDPLDGTVEFIKGNNEFTVNIALMENNVCIGAVVYVPYFGKMYVAGRNAGSFLKEGVPDAGASYTYDEIVEWLDPAAAAGRRHDHLRVAVSRSHQTSETHEHIERLRARHLEVVEQGSSYKFCMLAEGERGLLRAYDPHLRVGYGRRELILAEAGGRPVRCPGMRSRRVQRRRTAQPPVRLPVEILRIVGFLSFPEPDFYRNGLFPGLRGGAPGRPICARCRRPRSCPSDRTAGGRPEQAAVPSSSWRLLDGAFDSEPLHVLVGRDFRVDVMAFYHQRQRHAEDEQTDGRHGAKQKGSTRRAYVSFLIFPRFAVSGQMYIFVS